ELRLTAKELLNEKGLSVQLLDALNCTSKDSLEKSISLIEKAFNEIKKEAPNRQIKGAVPGQSKDNDSELDTGDAAIRKAMGLQ
ncbi:MAG: hypothetical protein RRY69_07670, partial [Oscillospiraceae bacterium]